MDQSIHIVNMLNGDRKRGREERVGGTQGEKEREESRREEKREKIHLELKKNRYSIMKSMHTSR